MLLRSGLISSLRFVSGPAAQIGVANRIAGGRCLLLYTNGVPATSAIPDASSSPDVIIISLSYIAPSFGEGAVVSGTATNSVTTSFWFAATGGNASNTGAINSAWDLATALAKTATVQPGNTLYIRGGTYVYPDRSPGVFGFLVSLKGESGNPITIRPYKGEDGNAEHVIIDGGITSNLTTIPEYVIIRELEVIVGENLTETRTT